MFLELDLWMMFPLLWSMDGVLLLYYVFGLLLMDGGIYELGFIP